MPDQDARPSRALRARPFASEQVFQKVPEHKKKDSR